MLSMRYFVTYLFLIAIPLYAETPTTAQAFVDSVGVNIHLSYTNSIYATNFPLILKALQDLHVKHVRDGIRDFGSGKSAYYMNHNALASAGIGCDYIAGMDVNKSIVAAYPSVVYDMQSLEAANELDNSDPNWVADLKAELAWLSPLAQALGLPLVGPSFVNPNSASQFGKTANFTKITNLHNYFAGFSPETLGWGACNAQKHCYASIPWNLDQAAMQGTSLVWTTETGYDVNTAHSNSVPANVYATYLPRLLLAHWNAGIKRTFIYELADDPSTAGAFGLLDSSGTRRPAFVALSALLNLLQDPGNLFFPTNTISLTISGQTNNVQHPLMQKRDGSIYLALWIGTSVFDPNAKQAILVMPQALQISLPPGAHDPLLYSYDANWNLVPTAIPIQAGGQISVIVGSNVSVLKLSQ
jgi:hypothetical protein